MLPSATDTPVNIKHLHTAKTIEHYLSEKLANADKRKITEYRETLEQAHPYQVFFDNLLAPLKTPEDFCRQRLQEALQNKYNSQLNPQDLIRLQPRHSVSKAMPLYTLLDAAMLNFTDIETAAHYFSDDSETLTDAQDIPTEGSTNTRIGARQFAALSRMLDLGVQYQNYISRTFNVSSVKLNALRLAKLNMKLATYSKYFSNDIHQSLWFMLKNLSRGSADIANGDNFNNAPLQLYSVELFGKYLVDAVLITCRLTDQSTQDRYLIYVPNDTGPGFYLNPDEDNCRITLAVKLLGQSPLRKLFASRLPKTDQNGFLTSHLSSISFIDDITFQPLKQRLFEYIASRHLDTFLADARQCAVPVADISSSNHQQRREPTELQQRRMLCESLTDDFSKRLRTCATDALISEVFSGVEGWTSAEKLHAIHQLLDLKEKSSLAGDVEPTAAL